MIAPTYPGSAVVVVEAVSTLPFPPVSVGMVPDSWNGLGINDTGVIPEIDVEMRSTGSLSLTAAELFGAKLHALVVEDKELDSVANATDTITAAAHGLFAGDGPFRLTNVGGALPAGLVVGVDYWIADATTNTFKLALSLADALAATPVVVNLTGDGTGTHTLSDTTETKRLYYFSCGVFDATIALTPQKGYVRRADHRPQTICYAVVGSLSAGTVSIYLDPVYPL